MLVLFTSSLLYYSGKGAEGFESIPATMYLSILMLTGQGEPDGELTTLLKSLRASICVAIFSVAMVAIPASMLTFGFEIEAQRLVLKRRERRLRRHPRRATREPLDRVAATARTGTRTFSRASGSGSRGAAAAVARTRRTCRPRKKSGRDGSSSARRRRRRSSASAANSRPSRRSTTRCCGPWRPRRRPCSAMVGASLRQRVVTTAGPVPGCVVYYVAFLEEKKPSL